MTCGLRWVLNQELKNFQHNLFSQIKKTCFARILEIQLFQFVITLVLFYFYWLPLFTKQNTLASSYWSHYQRGSWDGCSSTFKDYELQKSCTHSNTQLDNRVRHHSCYHKQKVSIRTFGDSGISQNSSYVKVYTNLFY